MTEIKFKEYIDELIVIRSATHNNKDYNTLTIAIDLAKEYLKEEEHIKTCVHPTCRKHFGGYGIYGL